MFWSSKSTGTLIGVFFIVATTAAAQGVRPRFGLAAGVTVPTGDYHAGFGTALQWVGLLSLRVPGWPVGLRADATYGGNGANDQLKSALQTAVGQTVNEKTRLLGANLDLVLPPSSRSGVKPYLLGGIGGYYTRISVKSGDVTGDNSATTLAWNVGGGMVWNLRKVSLLLEARFVDVAPVSGFPRMTFIPITAGIRFGSR